MIESSDITFLDCMDIVSCELDEFHLALRRRRRLLS